MRGLVRAHANGRTVLDCCSYVGGFSLAALKGGAHHADAVDYDGNALEVAHATMKLNGVDRGAFETFQSDVFDFLRKRPLPHPYDFIILDPPAFAKRSSDVEPAKRAYTDLNRLAMQALPPQSLLLTCSCSYQMDASLFQTVVFHAARQSNRSVKILERHRQALDHPVNIYHPETDYLKSLLLWIE
jgi:23S rRNA (cytosine1962-C5)-methyltransferase